MDRAKVVVDMYVSIDGKIDGEHGSMPGAAFSGNYYNQNLFEISHTDANGRKTIQMYAAPGEVDLTSYLAEGMEYEDYLPENLTEDYWSVSFDRKGKVNWQSQYFDYAGYHMRAIEVITKQADKRYLAFLKEKEIPFIIAGEKELDMNLAFTKLKQKFGIETAVLAGGALINGAALKQGVVDEISLVIAPYVNGDAGNKSSFDTMGDFVPDKFKIKTVNKLEDGGVQLIFAKEK